MSRLCPVLLLLVVMFTACKPPNAADVKRKGMDYFIKKDYRRAQIELRRAVELDASDPESEYYLGVASEELRDDATAVRAFSYAENQDKGNHPFSADLRLRRGRELLATREYDAVRVRAQWVLAHDPKDPKALELMSFALAGLAQVDNAASKLDELLREQPSNMQAGLLRASLYMADKDMDEARRVLQATVEATHHAPEALMAMGNFELLVNHPDAAQRDYEEAVQREPNRIGLMLRLGWLYARVGNTAAAEQTFKNAGGLSPKDMQAQMELPTYYMQTKQYGKAIALLEAMSQQQAAATLKSKGKQRDPWSDRVLDGLAAAYYLSGRNADAARVLHEVLEANGANGQNPQARLIRGLMNLQSGRYKDAIGDFTHVMNRFPEYYTVLYLLALAYHGDHQPQIAQQLMVKVMHQEPYLLEARIWQAETLLRNGDVAPAFSVLHDAPSSQQNTPVVRLLTALCYLNRGHPHPAAENFKRVLDENPDLVFRYYKRGFGKLIAGEGSVVRQSLEEAIKPKPGSFELLTLIAYTYEIEGHLEPAVARVQRQMSLAPPTAQHYQLLAELLMNTHQLPAAQKALESAASLDPKSPSVVKQRAELALTQGNIGAARQMFETLVKLTPQSSDAWTSLGETQELQGSLPDATQSYEKAWQLDNNNAIAANNLAWRMVTDGGDLTQAVDLARRAREIDPENPSFADTLGWIHFRMGSWAEAEKQLEYAVQRDPKSPSFQAHLRAIKRRTLD